MKVHRLWAGVAILLLAACNSDAAPDAETGVDTTLADDVETEGAQIADADAADAYGPMDYEDEYAEVEDSPPQPSYGDRRSTPAQRGAEGLRDQALRDAADAAMADAESYTNEAVRWREPREPEPRGNPGSWATTNDYPSAALREDREGTTGFQANISADGRVSTCLVTRSSGHADLDEATCRNIVRRARFRPATDSSGREVEGTWSSQVRWQIPS